MPFKTSWQNGAGNSDVRNLGKPTCLQGSLFANPVAHRFTAG